MTSEHISLVTVIGAGSWGTVIAKLIAQHSERVMIWARDPDVVASINLNNVNDRFLPQLLLPANVHATSSYYEALVDSELILWAIPVQFTRQRLKDCASFIGRNAIVVNLGKGLEVGTWYRPSQIILQECSALRAVGSLGGPNLASEIASGMPASATLAFANHWEVQGIEKMFTTDSFRVTLAPDLLALELAGALKNVVAIGAGICDGLRSGSNTKAEVVAQGLGEVQVVGRALGANPDSFLSSFALGDLLSTCYSTNSRNRSLGEFIGSGLSTEQAMIALRGRVAEGIATVSACRELSDKLGLSVPMFSTIDQILAGSVAAKDLVGASKLKGIG